MKAIELTINGEVYKLVAGFGFLREINSKAKVQIDDIKQEKKVGMTIYFANLIDGDVEALADVIDMLNKGQTPRLKRADIEDYIVDDDTDIDELFKTVIDFLSKANVSKKAMANLMGTMGTDKTEQ
ncbi:hypothetical protein H5996_01160 [Faecalicoccus pleomorphus]|uniref:tail assembly chaperone n=1 Tax=Faecalicoccus pleomorphus TaxID=1323 RepID=UPI0019611D59|nr:tail assembly chaperone [Faecalicoccus pleomorphus]MBM6764513.1 hypothetical protein [Faecalicoccus pleomorphus]